MSELLFVNLRGGSYAIEHPTDVHIRAVQEFAQTPVSNRNRQSELANEIQQMIPSLPRYLASCISLEQPDGTVEVVTKMNLNVHEVLAIAQIAALSYCQRKVEEFQETETEDKAERAQITSEIARLNKVIKDDLSKPKNPLLQVLTGSVEAVLPELTEGDEEPNGKPRPKPAGMAKQKVTA